MVWFHSFWPRAYGNLSKRAFWVVVSETVWKKTMPPPLACPVDERISLLQLCLTLSQFKAHDDESKVWMLPVFGKWCFLSLGIWVLRWAVNDLKEGYGISLYTRRIDRLTILWPSWRQKAGDAPRMTSCEEFWNWRLEFELFLIFLPSEMCERQKGQSLRLLCPNFFWHYVGSLKNLSGLYGSIFFYFPAFPCIEKYCPLEFLDQEFNFSLSSHTVLWPAWVLRTFSFIIFFSDLHCILMPTKP